MRRTIYMIATPKGLFMANRLMRRALNFTPATVIGGAKTGRIREAIRRGAQATELLMGPAAEISPDRGHVRCA